MKDSGKQKIGWGVAFLTLIVFSSGTALAQVNERGLQLKSTESVEVDEFQDYDQRYAIIVGINRYNDIRIPSLEYATEDAEAIQQLLIEKFNYKSQNVKLFLNEEATKANIMSALYAFQGVERNSQILFYFAGHGETVQLPGGGEMGTLLGYDVDRDQMLLTGIRMNEIRDVTNVMAAKHQLFLIDACYGGLAAVTTRALDRQTQRYLSNLLASPAKQIITAGGKGETVIERAEWGHSAFAKVLLDGLTIGLADLDKNGLVTGDELASYMKPRVNRFSENHQTPVYRKFTPDEGEFVFLMDNTVEEEQQQEVLVSKVSIRSTPSEADIIVNGEQVGQTPATVELQYGINNIRVMKDGFTEFNRSVEIQNPTFSVFAPLEKSQTRLQVTANVEGAEVYIDGELVGETPYSASRSHGMVKLGLRKEGYLPYEEFVLLEKEQSNINIELDQAASLSVRSNPSNAEVYLNGELKGQTPLELSGIVRAEYTLRLEKDNYPPVEETVDLSNKANEELNIQLQEYAGSIQLVGMQGDANVTLSGQQGVQKSYNNLPASSEKLRFGSYNVTIKKKGFKTVQQNITVDEPNERINVLNYLKPKSKFGSVMLSLAVPGGGQFYMGKTGRGVLFLAAGAASATYAVMSMTDFSDKLDVYRNELQSYRNATTDFGQKYQDVQNAYEAKESAKETFALSLGIFMGVRGLDLLDNLIFPSPKKQLEDAKVRFDTGGNSVTMRYNF